MQFEGAKVTEQGVTFGIVIVKPHVLKDAAEQSSARRLRDAGLRCHPDHPDGAGQQRRTDLSGPSRHREFPERHRLPADSLEAVHAHDGLRRRSHWLRRRAAVRAEFPGLSSCR